MKHSFKKSTGAGIIFLMLTIAALNGTDAQEDKIDWLRNSSHKIKDFAFLKQYLKDVKIVALGEQSHGDGATIKAKIELIKFLHEKLDFDLIAFESSMFDCYRENQNFMEGKKSAKQAINSSVFPVWTKSRQFQELIEYLSEQRDSGEPLRFCGFDAQPLSLIPAEERFQPVKKLLMELCVEVSRESHPHFYDLFFNPQSLFTQKSDSSGQEKIIEKLKEMGRGFMRESAGREGKVIGKGIEGMADILYMYWNADLQNPTNTPGVLNIRDRLMGEFIIFLKEEIYPDMKIILWGANSHLNYNRKEIVEGAQLKMVPAGDYLKDHFGSKYYAISFTSYEGKIGTPGKQISDVPPSNDDSLETMLMKTGCDHCFLNLRGVDDSHWLSKPIYGKLYGHSNFKAPWAKMTDAIFFIKEMTPSEMIEEREKR